MTTLSRTATLLLLFSFVSLAQASTTTFPNERLSPGCTTEDVSTSDIQKLNLDNTLRDSQEATLLAQQSPIDPERERSCNRAMRQCMDPCGNDAQCKMRCIEEYQRCIRFQ